MLRRAFFRATRVCLLSVVHLLLDTFANVIAVSNACESCCIYYLIARELSLVVRHCRIHCGRSVHIVCAIRSRVCVCVFFCMGMLYWSGAAPFFTYLFDYSCIAALDFLYSFAVLSIFFVMLFGLSSVVFVGGYLLFSDASRLCSASLVARHTAVLMCWSIQLFGHRCLFKCTFTFRG